MPRTLKLLLAAALFAPLCARPAPSQAAPQTPPAQTIADDAVERGKRLYHEGDAEGAIAVLRPAAGRLKKNADAWYYLGLALNRAGRAKDARKAFDKAVKLRPDDAGAHTGLAYTLLLLGKTDDAEREAQQALKLDPKLPDAHYVVGVLLYRGDKYEQAVEEAEAALRLKPDLPAAASLAGEALLNIYVDESERASQQYPLPPGADEAARKSVFAKRDAALESVRARMREAAYRMEDLAKSQPNVPESEGWRELAETLKFYGQMKEGSAAPGVFRSSELTTKAIIFSKPEPSYTEQARHHNTRGVVRLSAVLAADGQVKNILAIKRLPDGLTENAIAAARQIKFTPATLDGQPVSQLVVLEYNFNIY